MSSLMDGHVACHVRRGPEWLEVIISAESWSLVSYLMDGDPHPVVGALRGDGDIVEPPEGLRASSLMELLGRWETVSADLRSWSPAGSRSVGNARLTTPLRYPGKVICVGANYHTHLAEMGIGTPERHPAPYFFLKPSTTAVIGPYDDIVLPPQEDARVDGEAELGVVIGKRTRSVESAEALSHIAGYVVVNDVSARGLHSRTDALSPHFAWDWFASKGLDTFCPMGPGITPAWQVPDPQKLELLLTVNGVTKQKCGTSDMITDVAHVVAAASALTTLEPGDVIATGTPGGVGLPRGEYLSPGDEVAVSINGLGSLHNRVVPDERR